MLDWVPDPVTSVGREISDQTPNQNVHLQTAAILSILRCHLANTNGELGGLATAIPPFDKLSWSWLSFLLVVVEKCIVDKLYVCLLCSIHSTANDSFHADEVVSFIHALERHFYHHFAIKLSVCSQLYYR